MFVARRGDNSIYGCWTVKQQEGQEELADDHPEVVAFAAPKPPRDLSDLDNAEKLLKAICIYFGGLHTKTPAQVKAGIKAVYDSLP